MYKIPLNPRAKWEAPPTLAPNTQENPSPSPHPENIHSPGSRPRPTPEPWTPQKGHSTLPSPPPYVHRCPTPGTGGGRRGKVIQPLPLHSSNDSPGGPPGQGKTRQKKEDCHTHNIQAHTEKQRLRHTRTYTHAHTHVHIHIDTNTPTSLDFCLEKFWLLGSRVSVIHSPSQRGGRGLLRGWCPGEPHQVAVPVLSRAGPHGRTGAGQGLSQAEQAPAPCP